jgi:SAM-dependent methyltransferase
MDIDPEILAHYAEGLEHDRLTQRLSLELLRTQVLLERFLPPAPARVLDVGGASGVHASWLAARGYEVHLVDPVPLHVEQAAAAGGFTVALGDARQLIETDESCEAVLLLGPLYHLVERADRVLALREAGRVVRVGGVILAAAISRYASSFDGFFRGFADEPGFADLIHEDLLTGQHRNPGNITERFTTAYFHDRDGLAAEVVEAGLVLAAVMAIEGPLHWAPDIHERLADTVQRQLVLDVLAVMDEDPAVAGATAHMLAIAYRA